MLIDSHAHLNDDRLYSIIDEVVEGYRARGVGAVINAAYDIESSRRGKILADKYEDCYFTVGLHPHDARLATAQIYEEMKALAAFPKAVAWGETGLDYHYDLSLREVQRREFVTQIEIADSLKLPVIIHLREAYEDMNRLLTENKQYLNNGVLLHCYSGSGESARDIYNRLDCYYSFGGAITFAKHKNEVLKYIPQDRIMLETDCPYMTPVPFRGKTNTPALLYLIRDKMAELLRLTPDEIEKITTDNAKRFYKRIK
ncbi:MAG: TatD family deoxyribonuclease [Clostridia bacterium]|nr:TatD family deoxyribonuclease [Clostridia bacterium]